MAIMGNMQCHSDQDMTSQGGRTLLVLGGRVATAWSQQPWCCCDPHSMRSSSYLEHLIYHLWGHLDRKPTDIKTLNFLKCKAKRNSSSTNRWPEKKQLSSACSHLSMFKGLNPASPSFIFLLYLFLMCLCIQYNRDPPLPRRHHTPLSSYLIVCSPDAGRASLITYCLGAIIQPCSLLAAALRKTIALHTSWTSQLLNSFKATSSQHLANSHGISWPSLL